MAPLLPGIKLWKLDREAVVDELLGPASATPMSEPLLR